MQKSWIGLITGRLQRGGLYLVTGLCLCTYVLVCVRVCVGMGVCTHEYFTLNYSTSDLVYCFIDMFVMFKWSNDSVTIFSFSFLLFFLCFFFRLFQVGLPQQLPWQWDSFLIQMKGRKSFLLGHCWFLATLKRFILLTRHQFIFEFFYFASIKYHNICISGESNY